MNIQEIRQQYPQYQDLSDDQLASALHQKFYSDMPYGEFAAKVGVQAKRSTDQPQQPQERSVPDSIARQLGLTVRAGIGGLAAIPNAIADPAVMLANKMGANLPIPSQALERTMTRAGLPQPQGGPEEFAQATARGMVAPGAVAKAIPSLGANLGTQTVAAGLGAGGSDLARQAGFGPMGQFVAGLGAGVVPTTAGVAAMEGAKMAKNAIPAIIEPLTNEGRKRVVARAMQGAASDKDAAARNAAAAPEYVPGSKPTLGEASEDIGLGMMEKAVRNRNPEAFATREAERDAARQSGLEKSFGTATDLTIAEQEREAVTKPLREAAFANAKNVDTRPIINSARTITKSGPGARQEVGKAMGWVESRLKEAGKDPERIYAVRQDINDIIAGKMKEPEKASYQLAAKELGVIKSILDTQLEKAAPGFKDYLKTYAGMSREIDKAALGQEITAASRNPMTERISPAKYTGQFEKRAEEIASAGPVASDSLSRVAADLRRSAAPMAAGKTPGSDTLQNMVANSMLQRAGVNAGGPIQNAATKAAGLLYKPFGVEEATQAIARDAFLDPKMGAGLLQMELKRNPLLLSDILERLRAAPYGGLLGAGVANQ